MFTADHRAMLEIWAARGDQISRYMLDHNLWFPEALEALHRERCREPVPESLSELSDLPVPDDEARRVVRMIDREEWR